jgi:Putative adhesin
MQRRALTNFIAAVLLCVASAAVARAQDFQRSYNVGPNGSISIANVSGDVILKGYDGSAVEVSGFKEGPDRNEVEVEDLSAGGRVELRAKYPRNCNCDASIRFEIRVPRSVSFDFDKISTASGNVSAEGVSGRMQLNTASGNVTLQGVSGDIHANSASGTVRVREAAGTVSAGTASGDVDVELTRLEGTGDMRFSSASGNVRVRLPASVDADVEMSTASGDIDTNFPVEVKDDKYGSGKHARGRLGSGSRLLRISSASGDLSLKSI